MNSEGRNTIQAFWLGISSLSTFGLSIISAAILSRYFDKSNYGTYRQIVYIYSTLLVVFSGGVPNVVSYYLPRYDLKEGKDVVWKITKILFVLGLAFSVVLYVASGIISRLLDNPELEYGLKLFSAVPMLLLPTLGLEGIFSTYKKTIYIALYNIITRFLMLLCIVLPVIIFKRSYEFAIYGWVVVSLLSFFIALYFKGLPFKGIKSEKTSLSAREILTYSFPIATASLWSIAIRSADQFYISRYFGNEVFADFSNGFMILPFVSIVTFASSNVILPIFSKMINDKSQVMELANLWKETLIKSAIILFPIIVFCMVNARYLIVLVYSKTYEDAIIYFQIAMILNFFNIILFSPLLFSIGKTKVFSEVHFIFMIATWALEYLTVLLFDSPVAIAICSVVLFVLRVFVFMIYLSTILNINIRDFIPFNHILKLLIHSVLAVFISKLLIYRLIPNAGGVLSLMLTFGLFLTLLISTSRIFNLNYIKVMKPILNKFFPFFNGTKDIS